MGPNKEAKEPKRGQDLSYGFQVGTKGFSATKNGDRMKKEVVTCECVCPILLAANGNSNFSKYETIKKQS
ncbi:hypothetical protein VNO78_25115 [Psophocarpus tetragonolobus]|uniref:Uncharacterized protein n=1 Tax=Psophocarpus tetragonolobus TaxID=3891 RepID=A0AAN9XF47_PSOTE